MKISELERLIETLRSQALVLNNTADQLERNLVPFKLMQSHMQDWQNLWQQWHMVWDPNSHK